LSLNTLSLKCFGGTLGKKPDSSKEILGIDRFRWLIGSSLGYSGSCSGKKGTSGSSVRMVTRGWR